MQTAIPRFMRSCGFFLLSVREDWRGDISEKTVRRLEEPQ